jgi:hypothetical protein
MTPKTDIFNYSGESMQVHSEAKPKVTVTTLEPLREHRVLYLSQSRLDELIGGFSASQVVLLDSSSRYVLDLTSMLCVSAVSAFSEEVVFVDGGNSIDPYGIANICKKRGYDKDHVLSQINCARAFTAYQLVTLINDRLENMVKESKASTLVVSRFVDLFFDKDMPWTESFQLIKRSLGTIKRLTKKHNLITIITNYGLAKLHFRRGLRNLMYNIPEKLVRIEERKKYLLISMPKKDESIYYYPVPTYQTLIDDFFLREH